MSTTANESVQIRADHDTVKHLGTWTTSRSFDLRARYCTVELDLRAPAIVPGEITVHLDMEGGVLKLLVPDGAVIDQSAVEWSGRARVKDAYGKAAEGGRRIVLSGHSSSSEIRIHRGGVAVLSAMFSREYLDDVRRAHRDGTQPTVDDPTRNPQRPA